MTDEERIEKAIEEGRIDLYADWSENWRIVRPEMA